MNETGQTDHQPSRFPRHVLSDDWYLALLHLDMTGLEMSKSSAVLVGRRPTVSKQ